MGTAIAELSNLCPPSEDGAVDRALTELQKKLDAYSSVMTTTHRTLEDLENQLSAARDAEPATRPETAIAPAPVAESPPPLAEKPAPEPVEADGEVAPKRESHSKSEERSTGSVAAKSEPEPERSDSKSENPDGDDLIDRLTEAIYRSDLLKHHDDAETPENAETLEPTNAPQKADEDVEDILASVDAEVAEQLRARHAAAGGNKTLRQVCDEYFEEIADAERMLSDLDPEMAKAIRVQFRLFNGRKSIHQLVKEYEPPKEQSKKKSWWRG